MSARISLITEDAYLPALLKLLDRAEREVDVLAFSFAIGSAAGRLSPSSAPYQVAEKLVELRRERGLRIRLYIEGERETADRNLVTAKLLKKSGIQVKLGATHAKGFCVDKKSVLFGSTNLTNQSMVKNHETNLLLQIPAVARGFEQYFSHLWRGGRHGGVQLDPPLFADGAFEPALIDMIDRAKRRLEFSIYFFHQRDIEAALVRAHKRGVVVTGLLHHHEAFALSYVRRTKATADRLLRAGIRDLHFGPGGLFTHSKYLIRDRKEIALGTGNWLDEDIHIHPQLYILLRDPKIAKELGLHLRGQIREERKAA